MEKQDFQYEIEVKISVKKQLIIIVDYGFFFSNA